MKQRFREDTAGTLVFYPPENAVPTVATVTLYDSAGAVLQASASATASTVSTTVAAGVAKDAVSFTVASATGISAGDKLLVTEAGQPWVCEVKSIASTTVYPLVEIPFALTTSTTVKGLKITYTLTTTHTANKGDNFQAHWQYTQNSVVTNHVDTFDVVAAIEFYKTTYDDVVTAHPRIAKILRSKDLDLYEPMRMTWRKRLIPMLKARGIRIERVRDFDALIPLHVDLVNEWSTRNEFENDAGKQIQYEEAKRMVEEQLDILTKDVDWYDADDDLTPSGDEEHGNFRIRLTR